MNLLSIGAAYGVVTAIFQWGWGTDLLGLDHAMPVSSWVPILMFAILFGLSMDYEVFLLSRIREDWLDTGDPHGSVVRGLAVDRPGDLVGRRDHGRGLPRLRQRGRRRGQDARRRDGRGDRAGRDAGPDGAGARDHVDARARGTGGCPAWLDRLLPTVHAEVAMPAPAESVDRTPVDVSSG